MRKRFLVNGFVQGVGFRPFIKRQADRFALGGFVKNTSKGVEIEIEGNKTNIEKFEDALKNDLPFPATIFDSVSEEMDKKNENKFLILPSETTDDVKAYFSLDLATCDDCLNEMSDSSDRRFNYPFINCTACGPRYTIIEKLPYDRPNTTMKNFRMCTDCEREYKNHDDRRFHAQPIACPVCGPKVELILNEVFKNSEAIKKSAELLKSGEIIAIKGLGGYHLACDATNQNAVLKLREIKNRDKKPFALMVPSIEVAKKICGINLVEEELLKSKIAPILLLNKIESNVAESVAPNNSRLGLFLPYTPVHHLLFQNNAPKILVMTSANDSSEPIISNDEMAITRFKNLNIPILTNNRPINFRDDDSVIQVVEDKQQLIRHGRGFLPRPIPLKFECDDAGLAMGGDLKNAFAILLPGKKPLAVISPFIGDLEHPSAQNVLEETIYSYLKIFDIKPKFVVGDLHPKYFSSAIGKKIADKLSAKFIQVQHHHAHIVSVMAEYDLNTKCIGLAMDGTGFGDEKTIWGAECLITDFNGFERESSIIPLPLIGGDKAVEEPWRIASAVLIQSNNKELSYKLFGKDKTNDIDRVIKSSIPYTKASSMGRLFDAAASIALGINEIGYEAEAAIQFEQCYKEEKTDNLYSYDWTIDGVQRIDFSKLIIEVAKDKLNGVSLPTMSYKFHQTVVNAMLDMVNRINYNLPIVLSGGCFQNVTLLTLLKKQLESINREVYIHRLLPVNDGSIALGQVVVGANSYRLTVDG